jgi:hypothetical protein
VLQLLVTADIVRSSLTNFTPMMRVIHYSETSVLTGTAWRHTQKDGILQRFSEFAIIASITNDKEEVDEMSSACRKIGNRIAYNIAVT